jgi:metal-responsive CopG/Arc/MetJ family transcriptional regulator
MLGEKARIVTFKIEPQTLVLVDKAAIALGKTRSEIIREAIKHYIKQLNGLPAPANNP